MDNTNSSVPKEFAAKRNRKKSITKSKSIFARSGSEEKEKDNVEKGIKALVNVSIEEASDESSSDKPDTSQKKSPPLGKKVW